jgi:peptidyl-Lys metalloendopeptidase
VIDEMRRVIYPVHAALARASSAGSIWRRVIEVADLACHVANRLDTKLFASRRAKRVTSRDAMRTIHRVVLILAFTGCVDRDPTPRQDLRVELQMSPAVAGYEAVIADVSLVNTGDQEVALLSWYLPVSDLQEPVFAVARDGQPVAYVGPRVKRAQPDASDFVTIAPGVRLTWQVDLSQFYDFSQTGDYTVEVALDDAKLRGGTGVITSTTSQTWVEGRVAIAAAPNSGARQQCTSAEQAQIASAITAAGAYSNAARDYLNGSPAATPRYTTWFGAFSSAGWTTARSHFVAIADAFATKPITVQCGCKQKNVYAFVNPNQPYIITVCGAFWPAPAIGTDSKAGTLVHEMSHFNVVASTNDNAYGQTACRALAQSDPAGALDNADSHEYFAENTPAQP